MISTVVFVYSRKIKIERIGTIVLSEMTKSPSSVTWWDKCMLAIEYQTIMPEEF